MNLEITKMRSLYFVGIKGVAMAALSIYCKELGIRVSGSDIPDEFPTTNELLEHEIKVHTGFHESHVSDNENIDLVVYTGAHGGRDNIEAIAARERNIPTVSHAEALGGLMEGKRQISVAGSHGKTTTAAITAWLLHQTGKSPSYAIGCGEIFGLGAAGHAGKGEFFVAEADEYVTDPGHDETPRFLWQSPEVLIVTNIDYDHPDAYTSLGAVQNAFLDLQKKQVGQKLTVVNADDPASKVLLGPSTEVVQYGFSPEAHVHISHVGYGDERTFFSLEEDGVAIGDFTLKVAGRHNVLNATAAAVACKSMGISWQEIHKALPGFLGTKRRFEKIGETANILWYDDYAHHPREIRATLAAARAWYPDRKIFCVFQPHTYSRTKALFHDFARSLALSDVALIADVYASARETDTMSVNSRQLTLETGRFMKHAYYAPGACDVISVLQKNLREKDLVVFMGAGDIYNWERDVVSQVSGSIQ